MKCPSCGEPLKPVQYQIGGYGHKVIERRKYCPCCDRIYLIIFTKGEIELQKVIQQ